ncbi:Hsp20/alpha crystallin family protein [Rhizobium herbae]
MPDRQSLALLRGGDATPEYFGGLRKELNKLLDDFSGSFDLPVAFSQLGKLDMVPDTDMVETENDLQISVLMRRTLRSLFPAGPCLISGEKKSVKETGSGDRLRSERSNGTFSRSLAVPFDIDAAKVTAKIREGGSERLHRQTRRPWCIGREDSDQDLADRPATGFTERSR